MKDDLLKCPECGSDKVTVSHLQRFMANTREHYCHSVKTHDANSEATCLDCQWIGRRDQLVPDDETHNAEISGERSESAALNS